MRRLQHEAHHPRMHRGEFGAPFDRAGFTLTMIVSTESMLSAVEARKALAEGWQPLLSSSSLAQPKYGVLR